MTAAEKYAELEAQGLERPVCECHGEKMKWSKNTCPMGGYWRCVVRARAVCHTWAEHHREETRAYSKEWRASNKERKTAYNASYYEAHREDEDFRRRKATSDYYQWHRAGGGYVKSRKRQLAARKATIHNQLVELASLREAIVSAES